MLRVQCSVAIDIIIYIVGHANIGSRQELFEEPRSKKVRREFLPGIEWSLAIAMQKEFALNDELLDQLNIIDSWNPHKITQCNAANLYISKIL